MRARKFFPLAVLAALTLTVPAQAQWADGQGNPTWRRAQENMLLQDQLWRAQQSERWQRQQQLQQEQWDRQRQLQELQRQTQGLEDLNRQLRQMRRDRE
jgi:hypothetical protein